MSPPGDAKKYAAKILARKKIHVPASRELEISEEQPWRRASSESHPVVIYDHMGPYRYMSERPSEEILETPNVLWAIPYGLSGCTPDRYQTVLAAVRFLQPQDDSVESIFQTDSGFYLLKVEKEETVKSLLEAKVAMNFRHHRAVFFYECLLAPQTKSVVISDLVPEREIKRIRATLTNSITKELAKTIKSLTFFKDFEPKVTMSSSSHGRWGELQRFTAILDFQHGLDDEETADEAADSIWKWESIWAAPGANFTSLSLPSDGSAFQFKFRLHPLCKFCHSDEHWSLDCRWGKEHPALKDWKDKDVDE